MGPFDVVVRPLGADWQGEVWSGGHLVHLTVLGAYDDAARLAREWVERQAREARKAVAP